MAAFGVILAYSIIISFEIYPIVKSKKRKNMALYLIAMGVSFIVSLLLVLGISIPSPAKPIEKLITMFFGK